MKVRRIVLILLTLMIVLSSMAVVSAGLLDFLGGSTANTEHDFGLFTMNIPEDSDFEETKDINPGADDAIDFSGPEEFLDSINEAAADKNTGHPEWEDSVNNISVIYLDFKEDSVNESVVEVYYGLQNPTENGDLKTFSALPGYDHAVTKVADNKLVLIRGDDLDMLVEMGESIKFN